jgi:hypothetical protein
MIFIHILSLIVVAWSMPFAVLLMIVLYAFALVCRLIRWY